VLADRYPFAAPMLGLYAALIDVWEDGWDRLRDERPDPTELALWTVERLVPGVVKATEAAGPQPLADAVADLAGAGGPEDVLTAWLAGDELPPVERYLARASLTAPLVALDEDAGAACLGEPAARGGRRCPRCAAAPQLSFRIQTGEGLVSGGRLLVCSRCSHQWSHSASACASCGETTGSQRTVFAEQQGGSAVRGFEPGDFVRRPRRGKAPDDDAADAPTESPTVSPVVASTFPHLRVDACATCQRYVIDVDLGRDPLAVPEVDELAAIPLDLYATERGLSKITPNLMGF
jgi:FdhE protein